MSAHDDIRILLPIMALGVADEAIRMQVEAHLEGCQPCRDEMVDLQRVADDLAASVEPAQPSAELRSRLLTDIGSTAAIGQVTTEATDGEASGEEITSIASRSQRRRRFGSDRLTGTLGGLAAAACIALVAVSTWSIERIDSLEQSRDASRARTVPADPSLRLAATDQIVEVTHSAAFRQSMSFVGIDSRTKTGLLVTRNLPPPAQGRSWQVWSIDRRGRTVSLDVIDEGAGLVVIPVKLQLNGRRIQMVAITEEPRGGSRQPTGDSVATAQLPV